MANSPNLQARDLKCLPKILKNILKIDLKKMAPKKIKEWPTKKSPEKKTSPKLFF